MTTSWPYPRVFAHRGAGLHAPENTLAALREGADRGFRGVEFDVKLSADGELILLHDDSLGRTTDGRGPVKAMVWAELSRLDAGSWHSQRFAGEPVPRLCAIARACRALEIAANVEIKPCPGREAETGRAVAEACAALWWDAELAPLLSSFAPEALLAARAAAPGLPRGMLWERVPEDWRAQLETLEAQALHCDFRHLHAGLAARIKAAGYWLFCYTVNDPLDARRLLDWGVDGFCTDRLDLIPASFGV